jgi:RimJ/RimL family protein N-acetyltransferase/O-antigen/teichoic acid export membrane protein
MGLVQARPISRLSLRAATSADAELLLGWRNDPLIRAVSRRPDPVAPEEHGRWLHGVLENPSRELFIAEYEGAPVGQVRLDRLDGSLWEISVALGPEARGRGLGRATITEAVAALREHEKGVAVVAFIRPDNEASIATFTAAGFKPTDERDAEGLVRYVFASPPGTSTRGHAIFTALMTAAAVLGFVKGVVFAKVLGPQDFGYYGLVLVVVSFGIFLSNWGVLGALNNQLPMAYGRRDADLPDVVDRSLGTLIVALAATAVVYLLVVLVISPADGDRRIALVLAAFLTVATNLNEFNVMMLRVQRRLIPLGGVYLARASLAIVAGVVAGMVWGWTGVVASELLALVSTSVIARRAWLPWIRVRAPRADRTRWLLRWGLPVTAANLIFITGFTADRVFVASTLPDDLGQYILASFVVTAWLAVSGMISQALAPQLLFEYGAGLHLAQVRRRALRIDAGLLLAGAVGLAALLLVRGPLEDGPLRDYTPGLDIMPLLYVGGLVSVLRFPGFILNAIRPLATTLASALGAAIVVVGGFALTRGDPTLRDFAWLFVAGQSATTVATFAAIELEIRRHERRDAGGG